jgi:hypothetical protein
MRAHWLRAVVNLSRGAANAIPAATAPPAATLVHSLLQDERTRGFDDGQGRPMRYLSWFGGRVAAML